MECLSHVIDDEGIHANTEKMEKIAVWPTPQNYNEIQCFLGLVQYIAQFLPDISSYSTPLSSSVRNGCAFLWTPVKQKCFKKIKDHASRTPILKPIEARNPEPIWVICDGCVLGTIYGQGPTWETCCPAGFLSKKFSDAQKNYCNFEQEALAILEGLLK